MSESGGKPPHSKNSAQNFDNTENSIEILDGISEGEQVILDGKNLKDGMRVRME